MNESIRQAANIAAPVVRGPHDASPASSARRGAAGRAGAEDFAAIVSRELGAQRTIKLSAHAKARMESRALRLSAVDEERLQNAVDTAAARGARQSLVMLAGLALIVNIPSRTVITAMESDGARGTVFTNIDSAIIAQGGDATIE
jgi:flagellar operon protein